ncbi:hypothetical protein VPH35_111856 [Triticum aestivum]
MVIFVYFAVLVLSATPIHVVGQPGFLSIDCGMDAELSGRKDVNTGIVYISDDQYVDAGENHRVAAEHDTSATVEHYRTLRSFPSGVWNCYSLPTEIGTKYMLRLEFFYGNYDGKNRLSTQFDLHLGSNYWDTYETGTRGWPAEAVFVAWASWVPVCLVNNGGGTPFVNSVELRGLGASLYPNATTSQSMALYSRRNLGTNKYMRDLSNSSLHGVISNKFALLTTLEYLNLLGNRLNGSLPDSLCKNNAGSHIFRYESDQDMCNQTISPPSSRNRTSIIYISVVVPALVVVVLVISYLIWRQKEKPNTSTRDPAREAELVSAPVSRRGHGEHLQSTENHRFTYMELEKFTNKFERFIGQGGFGLVYYGRLEDNTEVAVKMRSESSSHGLDEFLAEESSISGYCWEKDRLALVYEYMSQGNLFDHLRGKILASETLNWGMRVRVVLEAAQGLDYLHKGCSLPIIHRDVKTSNILLGQHLQAKIADFGLCKTYLSDTQTHVSTIAAGTTGYIDPEYYHTGRLTESSDVYSFSVVLLEIATGERPILPSHGHIVQRVKQKIASGDINLVADARLSDAYDVSSMWKVIDTAMACTSDVAVRRPTMAAVVVQLRESLALEEAREGSGVNGSTTNDIAALSTFGPSAR